MSTQKQTSKKFTTRPSPPYVAKAYCNEQMKGNDGNMYESLANSAGIYTWRKVKTTGVKSPTTKRAKSSSRKSSTKSRPSPSYSAQDYPNERMQGNDGNTYESFANSAGIYTWRRTKDVSLLFGKIFKYKGKNRYMYMNLKDPTTGKIKKTKIDRFDEFQNRLMNEDEAYTRYID